MPSDLQSRGFDVNVIPNVQLANPSYFNPYGAIAQGIHSGVSLGGQLQDIAIRRQAAQAEEQMRPLRQALLQGQVDEQPIHQQMLAAELHRTATQNRLTDLQIPEKEILAKEDIKMPESRFFDHDESGNLNEYESRKVINPQTGEVGYQPRALIRTVKTKEQLEQDRLNAEALRTYRGNVGMAASTRATTAQGLAAYKLANPHIKTVQVYDKDLNVYEQVINPDGSPGEAFQITLPNGQPAKRPQTEMGGLAGALKQLSDLSPAAPAGASPAQTAAPAATQAQAPAQAGGVDVDALKAMANQFAAPTAATAVTLPKAFASHEEAQAAFKSKKIKVGDRIIIAGVPGTWH